MRCAVSPPASRGGFGADLERALGWNSMLSAPVAEHLKRGRNRPRQVSGIEYGLSSPVQSRTPRDALQTVRNRSMQALKRSTLVYGAYAESRGESFAQRLMRR